MEEASGGDEGEKAEWEAKVYQCINWFMRVNTRKCINAEFLSSVYKTIHP